MFVLKGCSKLTCSSNALKILSRRMVSTTSFIKQQNTGPAFEHTLCSIENGVYTITLNSVKKRNALSLSMLNELRTHLNESEKNEDVKVIVIGHTGKVFSAGHDLKELTTERGSDYHVQIFQACTEVMNLVQDITKPVIAEVNGIATAAGCQLVATCDLAVASDKSTFAVPGVHIGLFCTTPGVALARSVNRKQALKMLFTGDSVTAQEALNIGILNDVVPEEDLQNTTTSLAQKIIRHSGQVIGLGKKTFYTQIKQSRNDAYCLAENVMVENLKLSNSQEGIEAFFQKRKPIWKD